MKWYRGVRSSSRTTPQPGATARLKAHGSSEAPCEMAYGSRSAPSECHQRPVKNRSGRNATPNAVLANNTSDKTWHASFRPNENKMSHRATCEWRS
jgi:hypothetical protein